MAYTAPAKETVTVVGGLNTQADKAALNGGGAIKTVWDAGSPSDFIDTNGGPIQTATCTFTTIDKNLSGTDIGLNVVEGTLCYVSTGTDTHITAGIYEITTVTNDDNIICLNIEDDGNDESVITVNVGGAFDGLQTAVNNKVNNGVAYNRYIYDNISTETITSTITVDTYGGTNYVSRIYIIGYNLTLTAEAEVTITTHSTLADGLLVCDGVSYLKFINIDFDGGNKTDEANHCVKFGSTGGYITFSKCKFHGATNDGVYNGSTGNSHDFLNCEFYDNGDYGYYIYYSRSNNSKIIACSFHDNVDTGLILQGNGVTITGCLAYNNTGAGFSIGVAGRGQTLFANCTSYNNTLDGFNIDLQAYSTILINNTSVDNGGYGYNLGGNTGQFSHFSNNHSSVNTSGHYSEGADNTFADFKDGDNIAGVQAATDIFTDVDPGSENFTPKTGSDLINNGLDAGTA